eukprot:TRINITY_DN4248_c0_g2_i1.p1 TRINITY_DN4248_c0_g2~~TRINITY_DN4248_c0_g2_i1.p1  ORF type:complete len:319 (+),score=91.68 TRINITY_DN4248_c0_g2_i1:173-1129(+)
MQRTEKGCLPGTNCLVRVPEDRFIAVERFGVFRRLLQPGLSFAGLDLCGACVQLRSVPATLEEAHCTVSTKTKDHEFVSARVVVCFSVAAGRADEAIYKLPQQDISRLINAFASDVTDRYLRQTMLEDIFCKKDYLSRMLHEQLGEYVQAYGFRVHRAEVTELEVSPEVMHAMNEVNRQRRVQAAADAAVAVECARILADARAQVAAVELEGEDQRRRCAELLLGHGASDGDGTDGGTRLQRLVDAARERFVQETGIKDISEADDEELQRLMENVVQHAGGADGAQVMGMGAPQVNAMVPPQVAPLPPKMVSMSSGDI